MLKGNMSRKVVHLTSVHHAFDNRIFYKECCSLARAGYDVLLVAAHAPGNEVKDGVRLRAVPQPAGRVRRFTVTMAQVFRAAMQEDAEVYHFHDPELMPVGALLKLLGKKVIYDVHEDYAVSMKHKRWLPRPLRAPAALMVRASESMFARLYDRVIAATPTIASHFRTGNVGLVQNFPWLTELCLEHGVPYAQREPVVAYVGALSDIRGLKEMTQAVHLLAGRCAAQLVMAGGARPGAIAELALAAGQERNDGVVQYLGPQTRPQVGELLGRARIGIVTLHPTENYVASQPTKLFEYMSAGLPVIASDFPLWRQIVESAGCGLLVDPLDPRAIAGAMEWLLTHPEEAEQMGRAGQRAVAERYNWEHEAEALLEIYDGLNGEQARDAKREIPAKPAAGMVPVLGAAAQHAGRKDAKL